MTDDDDNPFWRYSLAVYARPGVERACLALQDRQGLDVNLLLACCWAASLGHRFDAAALDRLDDLLAGWRATAIEPLRATRRQLKQTVNAEGAEHADKGATSALQAAVGAAELMAEQIAQARIHRALAAAVAPAAGASDYASLAADNLRTYCARQGTAFDDTDRADLATLVGGCFDDFEE